MNKGKAQKSRYKGANKIPRFWETSPSPDWLIAQVLFCGNQPSSKIICKAIFLIKVTNYNKLIFQWFFPSLFFVLANFYPFTYFSTEGLTRNNWEWCMIRFTCQVFLYSNTQFVASSNSKVCHILSPALHKRKQKGIIYGFRYIEVFTMWELAASARSCKTTQHHSRLQTVLSLWRIRKACSKLETRTMLSSRYNVFSF